MRVAILADDAAAVDSQHDMELLQSNVMRTYHRHAAKTWSISP